MAARHPERVSSLVLTATFAQLDTRTELAASIWQQLFASGQHDLLAQYVALLAFSAPGLNSFTPAEVRAVAGQIAPSIPAGTGAQVDLVRRADVREDLAGITAPTLVVVTSADALIPADLQHRLAESIPGATTAELPTGHLPFMEQPAQWLGLITEFTGRH